MNTSFYNGISGIKTHQFGMDVIADNISNVSTTAFKGSTPEFSTIFSTTLSDSYFESTMNQVGLGSKANGTALDLSQGIFENTDNPFDLAIGGEGWFGVQSLDNKTYYTRAGAFGVDSNGDLVDESGNYLLGSLGNNITPTTLSDEKLQQFGKYYNNGNTSLGNAYAISYIDDVPLLAVSAQSKINLPDILYLPPEPTTNVDFSANLDPKIISTDEEIELDSSDINETVDTTNQTLSINGTISNTQNIQNAKENENVIVTVTDSNNQQLNFTTSLDGNLNWQIDSEDISSLDLSNLTITAKLQTTRETPNVEHFSSTVISPEGKKNILDMTYTKRVPQDVLSTTWDAKLQILEFYEDYQIEMYDPTKTYDTNIYNVDLTKKQVTKIYDPTLYKVDTSTNKVYKIIDEQTGDVTFNGSGALLSKNIPTLSNGGVDLTVDIGQPYEEIVLGTPSFTLQNSQITFSGTSNLEAGKQINVEFTDPNGLVRVATGKVQTDGTWSATNEYTYTNDPTNIKAFNITHSGFEGFVSNVDLDKAKYESHDGYLEGIIKDYSMDARGNVIAEFDNGRTVPIAKVAIYHFMNDQGLSKVTSTMFEQSNDSGKPLFYTNENGEAILGSQIFSNRLEGSNVNFANALTELIVMQKAFDASSKSITTSDQMIQNAINMKK
ncbi:flagellar hook-basal body complex protein [Sulfurospirillum sp. 1307]